MLAARDGMMETFPFWGALALRLRVVVDTTCKTAWTDGKSLAYNPAYIASLTFAECVFLIAHEVAHCAFGHPFRRDGRTMYEWNVACDFAINAILKAHGFTLPKGVLLDPKFVGRSAEWIYDRTANPQPKTPPQPPGPDDDDGDDDGAADDDDESAPGGDSDDESDGASPGDSLPEDDGDDGDDGDDARPDIPGEVRDAPKGSPDDDESAPITEEDWHEAIESAALSAAAMGALDGGLGRLVGDLRRPVMDWATVLRRFVSEAARVDYSWARPNPRDVALGVYLPSLESDGLGPMAIGVDTSGSVDAVQLAQMQAEARALIGEANPVRTTVIYADHSVNAVVTFESGDPVTLEPQGGGGTDFRPAFDYVATMPEQPVCFVYLTDLCGVFPDSPPEYPVLWVNTGAQDIVPPFGEVVRVT
jgi:predicted metal-dependent peptidase